MGRELKPAGPPRRGQVYRVRFASGLKPVLVVSNDSRNRALPSVLCVRITTAPKPEMPSIVPVPVGEPVVGSVLCDDIAEVNRSALGRPLGGLSRAAMAKVDDGLRVAMALDRMV